MTDSPELVVQLKTGPDGRPAVVEDGDRRHYGVVFEVRNPPMDAFAATFELDETHYDPARTLRPDPNGGFRLETTTHGDYPVVVRLRTGQGRDVLLKDSLVRNLRRHSVEAAANPAVMEALDYIAGH